MMQTVTEPEAIPAPTLSNVPYGEHERQVLDVWQAPASGPTPVVFHIHGGGWLISDKSNLDLPVAKLLAAGISVVSINYRYLVQTILETDDTPLPVITSDLVASTLPPVSIPLSDAARALQFVRSKAGEWNLDKQRIGLSGGSAGACSCLWLTYHPDLAEPDSNDPVARESTKPWCAAVRGAQTTLDPQQMISWTPNSIYGGHAFGYAWNPRRKEAEFEAFLAGRDIILPWIEEYSPYALASADAPPVHLHYETAPEFGTAKSDPTHTANFGMILAEKLDRVGAPYELACPGHENIAHPGSYEFLVDTLLAPA
jgi:acetyl esterase/lipase